MDAVRDGGREPECVPALVEPSGASAITALLAQARRQAEAMHSAMSAAVATGIALGGTLRELKAMVPRGEWRRVLREQLPEVGESMAAKVMKIAAWVEQDEQRLLVLAGLSLRDAIRLSYAGCDASATPATRARAPRAGGDAAARPAIPDGLVRAAAGEGRRYVAAVVEVGPDGAFVAWADVPGCAVVEILAPPEQRPALFWPRLRALRVGRRDGMPAAVVPAGPGLGALAAAGVIRVVRWVDAPDAENLLDHPAEQAPERAAAG